MNRFLKYLGLLVGGIIIILVLLDILYTSTFTNGFPRNKTQYILSLNKQKIDYVFLGSSRVENTIISSEIEKITSKKAINLGTQGAKLDDLNIFLRLLISNKVEISKLFIQIDYIYNFESNSDIVRSQALPFIRSNSVIKEYLKRVDPNFNFNYYLPFYRYMVNDYRIGFREFLALSINKKSKVNFEDGFVPIYGTLKTNSSGYLPKTILKKNKSFNEIDSICKANAINVTYFVAPFCENVINQDYFEKLKVEIPGLKDFSQSIKEDVYFKNCSHLNEKGAKLFTQLLINELEL